MDQDLNAILWELLEEDRSELSDLNGTLYEKTLIVKEEKRKISRLEKIRSEEPEMFYPRTDSLSREEIEKSKLTIRDLEHEIDRFQERKNLLEKRISKMETILSWDQSCPSSFQNIFIFQEEERKRIAGDLHDTSLQSLVHLIHQIELCRMYVEEDAVKAKLELSVLTNDLQKIIDEIRDIIFNLRPMTFDDLGLKTSFERLLENMNKNQTYEMISEIDDVSCENNLTLLAAYRVVQEGLNNIIKHAQATRVVFRCKKHDDLCVIDIEDNGRGFCQKPEQDRKERHFGLSSMKERIKMINGRIDILSSEGNGTKIHMEIPLATV